MSFGGFKGFFIGWKGPNLGPILGGLGKRFKIVQKWRKPEALGIGR